MQIGPAEILVILFIALIVFGPQRLPEVGRQVGSAVRELRRMQETVRGELDSVLHPDIAPDFNGTSEPRDHTAIATHTGSSEIVGPDDPVPTADPTADPDDDPRFSGPPGSFI